MPETAVIYVPLGVEHNRWLLPAAEYVQRRGYQLVAVVRDWPNVLKLLGDGKAEVVVAVARDHLPAHRVPRVEIVGEEGPAPTSRGRRPRLIRRDGEG